MSQIAEQHSQEDQSSKLVEPVFVSEHVTVRERDKYLIEKVSRVQNRMIALSRFKSLELYGLRQGDRLPSS